MILFSSLAAAYNRWTPSSSKRATPTDGATRLTDRVDERL